MSQRGVQLVIGKLLTDADFRQRFKAHARACLADLREQGIELNETELAALVETDPRMWSATAQRINRRLHGVMSVASERVSPRLAKRLTQRQERVLAKVCEGMSQRRASPRARSRQRCSSFFTRRACAGARSSSGARSKARS
jgi:hypothetical protein